MITMRTLALPVAAFASALGVLYVGGTDYFPDVESLLLMSFGITAVVWVCATSGIQASDGPVSSKEKDVESKEISPKAQNMAPSSSLVGKESWGDAAEKVLLPEEPRLMKRSDSSKAVVSGAQPASEQRPSFESAKNLSPRFFPTLTVAVGIFIVLIGLSVINHVPSRLYRSLRLWLSLRNLLTTVALLSVLLSFLLVASLGYLVFRVFVMTGSVVVSPLIRPISRTVRGIFARLWRRVAAGLMTDASGGFGGLGTFWGLCQGWVDRVYAIEDSLEEGSIQKGIFSCGRRVVIGFAQMLLPGGVCLINMVKEGTYLLLNEFESLVLPLVQALGTLRRFGRLGIHGTLLELADADTRAFMDAVIPSLLAVVVYQLLLQLAGSSWRALRSKLQRNKSSGTRVSSLVRACEVFTGFIGAVLIRRVLKYRVKRWLRRSLAEVFRNNWVGLSDEEAALLEFAEQQETPSELGAVTGAFLGVLFMYVVQRHQRWLRQFRKTPRQSQETPKEDTKHRLTKSLRAS